MVLVFITTLVSSMATAAPPLLPAVSTDCGLVAGEQEDGVGVFRGIPYAAPPTGDRRWRAPVQPRCWNGTLSAKTFGAACPQSPGSMDIGRTDEDCLFLNVWSPAARAQPSSRARATPPGPLLPVMVWVHGGGYVFGSGNYPNYAPTADQARAMGVVLVSMNYRLGPFGWLATRELTADDAATKNKRRRQGGEGRSRGASGNYGYMDMVAALRWVRRNIRGFGGDPGAVTLYGQSAGGTATMALLAAPSARGLFHRAIMQSGSARYNTTLAQAERDNAYVLASAGCAGRGAACLRAAPAAAVMQAIRWDTFPGWDGQGVSGFPIFNFSWGNLAIIDGDVIPRAPVGAIAAAPPAAPGSAAAVPLVIGSTAQETDLFPLNAGVTNLSWPAYRALARRKMGPFGAAAVNATLAFYPDRAGADPEFQYTSLSSDIGVNCPSNAIARRIAAGTTAGGGGGRARRAPLYRYILTAAPSRPMFMLGSGFPGRYAFHTLDSVFLFNTTCGAMAGAAPTAADGQLTRRLRADIGEFVRTGAIAAWRQYPGATMELGAAGAVRRLAGDYHAEACAFWESHGFWKYSWAGN
eukprot:g3111.t1